MTGKEPQVPGLAVPSHLAAAWHDTPCRLCHCRVPHIGLCRAQTPVLPGQVQTLALAPGATGGSVGGPGTPSVPSQKATAAQDFHRWHMVNHSKSSGIPDPSCAGSPGWALCPEALGMGISALRHGQEPDPAGCQHSCCWFALGAPRTRHGPVALAAEWTETTVGGETEAQGEVSHTQLTPGTEQTPGWHPEPAATKRRADPAPLPGRFPLRHQHLPPASRTGPVTRGDQLPEGLTSRALTPQGLPGTTQPAASDRDRPSCPQKHHLHDGLTQGLQMLCQKVTTAQQTAASTGTPPPGPHHTWLQLSCGHQGWQVGGTGMAAPRGTPHAVLSTPRADVGGGRDWRKKVWRGWQTPQEQCQGIPICPTGPRHSPWCHHPCTGG